MGHSEYIDVEICPECQGEGVVPDPFSQGLVDTKCNQCDGEGVLWFEDNVVQTEEDNNNDGSRPNNFYD